MQANIKKLSPRALYVHSNRHILNLSIANACKLPPVGKKIDTLNAVFLFSICYPNDSVPVESSSAVSTRR